TQIQLIIVDSSQLQFTRSIILAHAVKEEDVRYHLAFGLKAVRITGVWYLEQALGQVRVPERTDQVEERGAATQIVQHFETLAHEVRKHRWNRSVFNLDELAVEIQLDMRSIDWPASTVDSVSRLITEGAKVTVG